MKKGLIALISVAVTLTLGAGIFFGFTPAGREIITGYHHDMEKAGKVLAPASAGEEFRKAPEELAWGLAFPEATRAGP